ncbi:MAG: FprA family A-type flavoprotein [Acetatifactor sp.]
MEVAKEIFYVGVNDHSIDLFEGQYVVPNGMAYNSYVILDEKIAVMDTVDEGFTEEWLGNLEKVLQGRNPDYLVIQHMEPDHSASIPAFLAKYPEAQVVGSTQAFKMMGQFFDVDLAGKQMIVANGGTLELGTHTLQFVAAPMVHWPEVLVTYDATAKVLFSADAFGKFGALDVEEDWACEARRYYFGIVGKYGMQAGNMLKKAAALDIQTICPLHGPILSENLDYYLNLYSTWTSYGVESEGVFIAYASIYGHTAKAAECLASKLEEKGIKASIADLAREDMAEAVEDAFRYGKLVLACNTYNNSINPFMQDFINRLVERNYQKRTIAFIENGSWAPMAAKVMKGMLEGCKELTFTENTVTILSAMKAVDQEKIAALAEELA